MIICAEIFDLRCSTIGGKSAMTRLVKQSLLYTMHSFQMQGWHKKQIRRIVIKRRKFEATLTPQRVKTFRLRSDLEHLGDFEGY